MRELSWLPTDLDWKARLAAIPRTGALWEDVQALAKFSLDFVQTGQLDRRLTTAAGERPVLRLAILASSTVDQLLPGLRVAALRRGYRLETYLPSYGQYRQAVLDPQSELYAFKPDVVLFALDATTIVGTKFISDPVEAEAFVKMRVAELSKLWRAVTSSLQCQIIQQTLMPVFSRLAGSAEHRVTGSPANMIDAVNSGVRVAADADGVDILALDKHVQEDGLSEWFVPPLWYRAKQEISPAASEPMGS